MLSVSTIICAVTGVVVQPPPILLLNTLPPTGPAGKIGLTGSIGLEGSAPPGPTGQTGPVGKNVLISSTGNTGQTGHTGPVGIPLIPGPTGATGGNQTGPSGSTGETGGAYLGDYLYGYGGMTLVDENGLIIGNGGIEARYANGPVGSNNQFIGAWFNGNCVIDHVVASAATGNLKLIVPYLVDSRFGLWPVNIYLAIQPPLIVGMQLTAESGGTDNAITIYKIQQIFGTSNVLSALDLMDLSGNIVANNLFVSGYYPRQVV